MTAPRVWNRRYPDVPEDAVNIMRPTEWGNYETRPGMTRAKAVAAHRARVLSDPAFIAKIQRELHGKDLVCNCKPKACHGDVLFEVANRDPLV